MFDDKTCPQITEPKEFDKSFQTKFPAHGRTIEPNPSKPSVNSQRERARHDVWGRQMIGKLFARKDTDNRRISLVGKVSIVLYLTLALSLVLNYGALRWAVEPRFKQLDHQSAKENLERALRVFEEEERDLVNTAKSWAFWDDSHAFALGTYDAHIGKNLYDSGLQEAEIDGLQYLSKSGEVIWSKVFDPHTGESISFPELASILFEDRTKDIERLSIESNRSGIMETQHGPMIAAAVPILKSDLSGPAAGALVMLKFVLPKKIENFRRQAQVDFGVIATSQVRETADGQLHTLNDAGHEKPYIQTEGEDDITLMTSLDDAKGTSSYVIRVRTQKDFESMGESAMLFAVLLFLFVGLLITLIIQFSLKRIAINPLTELTKTILEISRFNRLEVRSQIEGNDEIADLAREFNAMLDELEKSREIIKQGASRLRETSFLLETTLDTIDQGVVVYDKAMNLTLWNKSFQRIMELTDEQLERGMSIRDYYQINAKRGEYGELTPNLEAEERRQELGAQFEQIKPHRYVRRRPTGQYIEIIGRPMPNGGLVATYTDITKQKAAQDEIERLAWTDNLTGLLNRNVYRTEVIEMMNKAEAEDAEVALLFIDLDGFKGINDTYGHDAGDDLLVTVAERIQKSLRKTDLAFRLGGDEFAVALFSDSSRDKIHTIARRLIETIMVPIQVADRSLMVGASIGISFFPTDDTCIDELTRKADLALYQAKNNGRGIFRLYDLDVDAKAKQLKELEDDLREAVIDDQFKLYFQPIVCASTGRLSGAEALIRWHHPTLGLIPPGDFISVVEHTDLVFSVGAWVLRNAWETLAEWQGRIKTDDFTLGINVSTRQFFDESFRQTLRQLTTDYPDLIHQVDLEITEEVMLQNVDEAFEIMTLIASWGFQLSLDDFGTGYSSFSYLNKLPVQKIKIDRSFIEDIESSDQGLLIVNSIVELGHNLNMTVLAEGVETKEQMSILSQSGCDLFQGFLFGKPQTRENFERQLDIEYSLKRKTA